MSQQVETIFADIFTNAELSKVEYEDLKKELESYLVDKEADLILTGCPEQKLQQKIKAEFGDQEQIGATFYFTYHSQMMEMLRKIKGVIQRNKDALMLIAYHFGFYVVIPFYTSIFNFTLEHSDLFSQTLSLVIIAMPFLIDFIFGIISQTTFKDFFNAWLQSLYFYLIIYLGLVVLLTGLSAIQEIFNLLLLFHLYLIMRTALVYAGRFSEKYLVNLVLIIKK